MDELVQFLRDRLNDDQRIAEAARGPGDGRWHHDTEYPNGYVYDEGMQPVVYDESTPSHEEAEHIARHDPARVLHDIEARRQIVAEHDTEGWKVGDRPHDCQWTERPCRTLRLLATVYGNHPEYREEWAP